VALRDPFRYFRVEASDLLDRLGSGALDLERGAGAPDLVAQMLRLAHTLKGASRVVGQTRIAELSHAVEDVLTPHREPGRHAIASEKVDQLLKIFDEIGSSVSALGAPAAAQPEAVGVQGPESVAHLRIAAEEMDALLLGVVEADVRVTSIRREVEELGRAHRLSSSILGMLPPGTRVRSFVEDLGSVLERLERRLAAGLDHVDNEISQVRERTHELRLVPAGTVFSTLERAARDVAQSVGRAIHFETSGGEHRLEANVLFALRDALMHVVRNAVDHGIEPEAERRNLGKALEGRIQLDVERRGNRIAFVCRDDGRGIDIEGVRRAAVARGAMTGSQAASLGAEQLRELILTAGISTMENVTEVSGRGIGLDVLRATVAQLKGEVSIASQPGAGTTVDVCVPLSLSSFVALVVQTDGVVCSLPLDCVRQTLRIASGDIARSTERDSVVVDGVVLPFMQLGRAMKLSASKVGAERPRPAVVVQVGSRCAAIGVDRLVGTSTVVLRPLPKLAGRVPMAAGASLDAEGNPQLVLEPRGVIEAAYAHRGVANEVPAAKARAPVLIVDDSLTTRMLEQSILESAGYQVDLATSAEEALTKAREVRYSLFLVDVEMPGMDGFEFVSRTRADPSLLAIPAILVTSRNGVDDRRRGSEVGARAYIVKGEFDQGHLLREIRQLIG
jgi:two-component system chemotaxis sensor kinase CheA